MKVLVVFPGHEAFYKGMGSEIVENYPEVSKYYEVCKKKTGLDIFADCIYAESGRELTAEDKKLAVLITSVAFYQIFREKYDQIDYYLAGEGVGYLSALACCGAISISEAIRLIKGRKPATFFIKETFHKVLLPSTGKPAQTKKEVIDDINAVFDINTALSNFLECAVDNGIECIVDCGPDDMITKKTRQLEDSIRCSNLDDSTDPNHILEGFEYKKLFNKYYCALRVLGMMSSSKNRNASTDEYRADVFENYQAVKAIADKATMKLYQTGIVDITQEEFNECFERLNNVFELKKISHDEIENRLDMLEKETLLNIKEIEG